MADLCRPRRAWSLKRPDDDAFGGAPRGAAVAHRQHKVLLAGREPVRRRVDAYDAALAAHSGGAAALAGRYTHPPPMVDARPGFL